MDTPTLVQSDITYMTYFSRTRPSTSKVKRKAWGTRLCNYDSSTLWPFVLYDARLLVKKSAK